MSRYTFLKHIKVHPNGITVLQTDSLVGVKLAVSEPVTWVEATPRSVLQQYFSQCRSNLGEGSPIHPSNCESVSFKIDKLVRRPGVQL